MRRRGMTEDADFRDRYAANIGARQFAEAATLREEHPRHARRGAAHPCSRPDTVA
jgi:hypothetical protein